MLGRQRRSSLSPTAIQTPTRLCGRVFGRARRKLACAWVGPSHSQSSKSNNIGIVDFDAPLGIDNAQHKLPSYPNRRANLEAFIVRKPHLNDAYSACPPGSRSLFPTNWPDYHLPILASPLPRHAPTRNSPVSQIHKSSIRKVLMIMLSTGTHTNRKGM